MPDIRHDIERQREKNAPPQLIGNNIPTLLPDSYNFAEQQDPAPQESIFHPVKAIEDILEEFQKLHTDFSLLIKAVQKEFTFFDTVWALGLNVGYTADYKGMPFMSVFCLKSVTLLYSSGGSTSITANTWTHISPPRNCIITIQNGSDSSPQVMTFRVGQQPYTQGGAGGASSIVQANAGSGWTTSGLAIETGGNLAAAATRLASIITLLSAPLTVNTITNYALETGGNLAAILAALDDGQETMANSLSVAIASDQSAVPVTANAGTNLNTSLLALESGGNLAAILAALDDGQETMANSFSVAIASDQSTVPTQSKVGASGGAIPYHRLTAATANFTNEKAAAGQLYGYTLSNTSNATIYVKFYDKASQPGTGDTPFRTIMLNAFTLDEKTEPNGLQFSNGFGWAATGAVANNDNTAIAANCIVDFDLNS